MDRETLKDILEAVRAKELKIEEAVERLSHLPYEEIGCAKIDHHRALRQGIPEVVFSEGKSIKDTIKIGRNLYKRQGRLVITRASEEIYRALRLKGIKYHKEARMITYGEAKERKGLVLVISAGTADIPIAEEASITAEFLGSSVERLYDIGVAGIHRLLRNQDSLKRANSIVVVAGMEGALPSVVGGLTDKPIIAVPTSVGYGTNLGGLTALFAMLNSCVPGIGVVNIDNGFGAGCLAHKINLLRA